MYPHRCSNVRLYRHPFGVGTLFLMILAICRRSDAWITTRPVRIATLRNSVTVGRDRSVVTALFLTASSTETFDRTTGRQLVQEGMQVFRAGNVQQSIELFDLAEQKEGPSLTPYLWQRGLSYYYDDNFAAASRQFRTDVSVNPADVEEIVWDIASQLRIDATEFPIPNQLSLLVGTTDRRRIMSTVYKLFRGEGSEHDLALAGHAAGSSAADEFYALFYLGLYCEARGEETKAAEYMRTALRTRYARASSDYMAACAAVHCQRRGWVS